MIYIFLTIVLGVLVNRVFNIKNFLNPYVFFFVYQTVFFFLALSYKNIYSTIEISNVVMLIITVSYFLTFFGAVISRLIFGNLGFRYVRIVSLEGSNRNQNSFFYSSFVIYLMGLVCYGVFYYKIGGFLLFADDLENVRISSRMNSGLITLLYVNFMIYGFLGMYMSGLSKIQFFFLFVITAFCLISFGSRAPLMQLTLGSFIINIIHKMQLHQKIKYKSFVIPIGLLFAFLIIFGVFRSGVNADMLDLMISRAGWRPFVNIHNFQKIYDFFPYKHNFLYGETMLIDLKLFLPGSNPNFGTVLKDIMNWRFDGGSITASFIGLGYINFGFIGIVAYSVVYGFIFNTLYELYIISKQRSYYSTLILMLLSMYLAGSVSSGILSVILNSIMFLIGICIIQFVIYNIIKFLITSRK